jgi:hypothetical protein
VLICLLLHSLRIYCSDLRELPPTRRDGDGLLTRFGGKYKGGCLKRNLSKTLLLLSLIILLIVIRLLDIKLGGLYKDSTKRLV